MGLAANQVRWTPVINADPPEAILTSTVKSGGTFRYNRARAVNATVVIYTVPAGQELWLTQYSLTASATAAGSGELIVYDAAPALLYYIDTLSLINPSFGHCGKTLIPPFILPAAYSIRVLSSSAAVEAYGIIQGWEFAA